MTVLPEDLEILGQLKEEFPPEQVKQREGPKKNGQVQWFSYIATDDLHERLDAVLGPNWDWEVMNSNTIAVTKVKDDWKDGKKVGKIEIKQEHVIVLGRLTVSLPSGVKIKRDAFGGCETNYGSQAGDPYKIADSGAFKKACYKLGIGRYLGLEKDDVAPPQSGFGGNRGTSNPQSSSSLDNSASTAGSNPFLRR